MDEKLTEKLSSLEARVEHIAAQVEALSLKVDGFAATADRSPAGAAMNGATAQGDEFPDVSEALLSWVRHSSLLQRPDACRNDAGQGLDLFAQAME